MNYSKHNSVRILRMISRKSITIEYLTENYIRNQSFSLEFSSTIEGNFAKIFHYRTLAKQSY